MKNLILSNIENPENLEQLYRHNPKEFEKVFIEIYPEVAGNQLARFWYIRLKNKRETEFNLSLKDTFPVIVSCLIVIAILLLPKIIGFNADNYRFYEKHVALIAIFGITIYTILSKTSIGLRRTLFTIGAFIFSAIYINTLPSSSSSSMLVYLHLPVLLWFVFGIAFTNFDFYNYEKRIEFIKYNGDLAVVYGLIAIAGAILTAFTIGLFSAIGINIENYYFEIIVIPGIASAPVVCAYLIKKFDFLSNRIASIIANIFTPLILITLFIYLIIILIKGSNPFINRDFLIVFNGMLVGVVALIIFSITERIDSFAKQYYSFIFFALTAIALVIDAIALSAIIFRITEYGLTPNRLAVVGTNLLFLLHILLVLTNLIKTIQKKQKLVVIEHTTAKFFPIYGLWLIFIIFILPFLFSFK